MRGAKGGIGDAGVGWGVLGKVRGSQGGLGVLAGGFMGC